MIELVCDYTDENRSVHEPKALSEGERGIKCVNVFKSQEEDMMQTFTKAWIELMNQAEQRRSQITNAK